MDMIVISKALSNLKMNFYPHFVMLSFALLICVSWSKLALSEQAESIKFIEEIPVMVTMEIEPEFSFSFDSPSGRVIMLFVSSSEDRQAINAFYQDIMPQLGWVLSEAGFTRGREIFKLVSSNKSEQVIWRLSITPVTIQ
jgi:hypothetical protein